MVTVCIFSASIISFVAYSAFHRMLYTSEKFQFRNTPSHSIRFFNEESFQSGIRKTTVGENISYRVVAGIVPHHTLAAPLLSDFFSKLAVQKPKRLLVIGPDHRETGVGHITTSEYAWNTPFGSVEPDRTILIQLKRLGILVDEVVSEYEHSIGALTPYIAYYLPDTQLIPIIVSGRMEYEKIIRMSELMSEYIDSETVVIASVDFSHNLHSDEADMRDAKTGQYIREFALKKIYSLNSEYIDSPASLIMVLSIAQKLQAKNTEIFAHSNSGVIQNNRFLPTTSYYTIALHE